MDLETGRLNLAKGAVCPSRPDYIRVKIFQNTAEDVRYNAEFEHATYAAVYRTIPKDHLYCKVGFSQVTRMPDKPGKLYLKGPALQHYLEYYVDFETAMLMAAGLTVNTYPVGKYFSIC